MKGTETTIIYGGCISQYMCYYIDNYDYYISYYLYNHQNFFASSDNVKGFCCNSNCTDVSNSTNPFTETTAYYETTSNFPSQYFTFLFRYYY